jgi:hypothetical protein
MPRKLLIIFLLCSLPLRVWAALSVGLSVDTPPELGVSASQMMIAMEECPIAQSHQLSIDSFSDRGTGHDCQACELCMSFGAGPTRPLIAAQSFRLPPPLEDERSFISILPPRRIKPPIA